ncbi:MAG: glycosyltransferase, partial [Planctomycetota bacterium]
MNDFAAIPEIIVQPKGKLPLVTVVVPMYNVGSLISECLRSLQEQTLTNWEAIVVDDGST